MAGTEAGQGAGAAFDLTDPRVFQVWVRDRVRYADLDTNGHVNNVSYAVYCESGRIAFFDAVVRPLIDRGHGWLVARVSLDYRSEMRFPGDVDIGVRVLSIGRTSIRKGYAVFQAGVCAATMESVCVHRDRAAGTSVPWNQALRERLALLARSAGPIPSAAAP